MIDVLTLDVGPWHVQSSPSELHANGRERTPWCLETLGKTPTCPGREAECVTCVYMSFEGQRRPRVCTCVGARARSQGSEIHLRSTRNRPEIRDRPEIDGQIWSNSSKDTGRPAEVHRPSGRNCYVTDKRTCWLAYGRAVALRNRPTWEVTGPCFLHAGKYNNNNNNNDRPSSHDGGVHSTCKCSTFAVSSVRSRRARPPHVGKGSDTRTGPYQEQIRRWSRMSIARPGCREPGPTPRRKPPSAKMAREPVLLWTGFDAAVLRG
eukprot:7378644-Prymnesium_polylepis.5